MAQQTTAPERKYIKDLLPNQFIDTVLTMNNCQLGQTRGGKPFLKCLLSDKSGQTAGRMWNATEELFEKLPTDGFVWVSGQTQPYQGQMQIIIEDYVHGEGTKLFSLFVIKAILVVCGMSCIFAVIRLTVGG